MEKRIDLTHDRISPSFWHSLSMRIPEAVVEDEPVFFKGNDIGYTLVDESADPDIGCFYFGAPPQSICSALFDDLQFFRLCTPGWDPKVSFGDYMMVVVRVKTPELVVFGCRDAECSYYRFELTRLQYRDVSSTYCWNAYILCHLAVEMPSVYFQLYPLPRYPNCSGLFLTPYSILEKVNN